jgi:hypothetical protein
MARKTKQRTLSNEGSGFPVGFVIFSYECAVKLVHFVRLLRQGNFHGFGLNLRLSGVMNFSALRFI